MEYSQKISKIFLFYLFAFHSIFLFSHAPLRADDHTASRDNAPSTIIPNGSKLPWKMVDGVKVFHLVAEEVTHEIAPGLTIKTWSYNGVFPGPTIEATEGDRVRIYVTNKLPEPTSVHWHGVLLPSGMDGVSGLSQKSIKPNQTFKYEFTLKQHGTHMYHSHFDEMTQIGSGATGLFIIHAKEKENIDKDFALLLGEWRVDPGTSRPNPNEMTDYNILTFNGKAYPSTDPLLVNTGDKVRIRVANLSQTNHHPIHIHGFQFKITETDGGQIPESAQQNETTVLTPAGSSRTIEFTADTPGDWAFHCHMTHHVMNQMGHGLPNMIGVNKNNIDPKIKKILPDYMTMGETGMGSHSKHMKHMEIPDNTIPMLGGKGPFGAIDMGGMFTIVKVRDKGDNSEWYNSKPEDQANEATEEELKRDLGED